MYGFDDANTCSRGERYQEQLHTGAIGTMVIDMQSQIRRWRRETTSLVSGGGHQGQLGLLKSTNGVHWSRSLHTASKGYQG